MAATGFKEQIAACFRHLPKGKIFAHHTVFLQLVIHMLLGYRRLREAVYYRDDPLVKRLLGLAQLPDVATISRRLKEGDQRSVGKLRGRLRDNVVADLLKLALSRVTLDFDGSVQSTKGHAEDTAVGFNRKKKGARSYYPLFCTVAQTGQVFDFVHRSGNVHDSRGARKFILECVAAIRAVLPHAVIEVRMDAAFFSDEIVSALDRQAGVEFTMSVPFERFPALKAMIENRRRWYRLNDDVSYFEAAWKPKAWKRRFRFILVRTRTQIHRKEPVQLDLFIPYEYGYQFKVVITNKRIDPGRVVAFHDGRGTQEGLFSELKSESTMSYLPVRTCVGNQLYLLAALFAHNLVRSIQMTSRAQDRRTTPQRAALWVFDRIQSFRNKFIRRAGRITRPQNHMVLTISGNATVEHEIRECLSALTEPEPVAEEQPHRHAA
jgi:hypothetical protein